MTRPWLPWMLAGSMAFVGCGSKGDDAVPEEDAQFTADYVDDYESDVEEDLAQDQEQALLDQVDDLDDVEVLDDASSSTFGTAGFGGVYGTKNAPPKHAPHGPVSTMEDDPHFTDATASAANLAEARQLGVRIVRVMIMWRDTVQTKWDYRATSKPNFTATDPDNYDFSAYDRAVENARAAGLQVLITLAAPMPYWASEEPQHCLDQEGTPGFWSCSWKPDVRKYAQWVTAVARHYKQIGARIWGWTVWNEPNIGGFLYASNSFDDAMLYRKMWFAARKHIRKTAGVRARVFFGDIANGGTDANGSRYDMLRHALCMKSSGEVYTGTLYADCPLAPRVVHAQGIAFHPYANDPTEYAGSLKAVESMIDQAEGNRRLRAGRGLYLTEEGFLTDNTDTGGGALGGHLVVTPIQQRDYDDAVAQIVFGDKRVRTLAQYELYDDVPHRWDCGLKAHDGAPKPAYASYKVAIDVSKVDASTTKVFALARLASGTPIVVSTKDASGAWHDLAGIDADETGFGAKTFSSTGVVAWKVHYLGDESREVGTP